jgi:hypothetical protein
MVGKSSGGYKPNGTKKRRTLTFTLVGIGTVLLIGPFLFGVNESPPGLLVSYAGSTALFAAFVHRWREAKKYLFLGGASLIGFLIFVILHNLFYALGEKYADVVVLGQLLEGLSVVSFLAAILVCPPGFLVGAMGAVVIYLREKLTA